MDRPLVRLQSGTPYTAGLASSMPALVRFCAIFCIHGGQVPPLQCLTATNNPASPTKDDPGHPPVVATPGGGTPSSTLEGRRPAGRPSICRDTEKGHHGQQTKIQNGRTGRGRGAKAPGNKAYEKGAAPLHVELVRLAAVGGAQGPRSASSRGARRGWKGATIKAITERSAPGSLGSAARSRPHGAGRKASSTPALHPHLPAAGRSSSRSQLVQLAGWSASWVLQRGGERQIL